MSYEEYTVDDFICDEHFINWVLAPNAENTAFWENLVENYPHKRKLLDEARIMVQLMQFEKINFRQHQHHDIWQNIQRSMHGGYQKTASTIRPAIPTASSHRNIRFWQSLAAALTGLLVMGLAGYFVFKEQPSSLLQHTTGYGETRKFSLPDGSVVVLNANSELKYESNWQEAPMREVWLQGEAFFEVVKTTGRKQFIVHTGSLDVEVLGTQFNVHNRHQKVQVVLNSGKVKLKPLERQGSLLMNRGELVEYSKATEIMAPQIVDIEIYTAWRNDKFVFKSTPISFIAQMLEDNYGYEVNISSEEIAETKFTATVPADIEVLLAVLSELLGVKIQHMENSIEIGQ